MNQKKHQSIAFRTAAGLVLLFSLIATPEAAHASGSGEATDNANPTAQQENNNKIKLLDKKPKVEDIKSKTNRTELLQI